MTIVSGVGSRPKHFASSSPAGIWRGLRGVSYSAPTTFGNEGA